MESGLEAAQAIDADSAAANVGPRVSSVRARQRGRYVRFGGSSSGSTPPGFAISSSVLTRRGECSGRHHRARRVLASSMDDPALARPVLSQRSPAGSPEVCAVPSRRPAPDGCRPITDPRRAVRSRLDQRSLEFDRLFWQREFCGMDLLRLRRRQRGVSNLCCGRGRDRDRGQHS